MNLIRLVSMREIKFKAKRLDNGEWAYGYGIIIADDFCVLDKRDELYIQRPYTFRNNTHWFELCGIMCDTNTLSQITGLKDKNGIEIYENDVIKADCFLGKPSCIVKWDVIGARFVFVSTESGGYLTPRDFNFEYVEVIGNTIDNPELLTNKN